MRKAKPSLRPFVLILAGLSTSCACRLGSGWTTSLETGLSATGDAQLNSIDVDPKGTLFATGWAQESAGGNYYWTTFRSKSSGASWTLVDQSVASTASGLSGGGQAVLSLGEGLVVTAGRLRSSGETSSRFAIRRSQDGGSNWTTVHTAAYGENTTIYQRGLYQDSGGNVWLAVNTDTSALTYGFRLLRSTDLGSTWTTVYDQPLSTTYQTLAQWTEFPGRSGYFAIGAHNTTWRTYTSAAGTALTTLDEGSNTGGGMGLLSPFRGAITAFGTTDISGKEAWRIRQVGTTNGQFASVGTDYQAALGKSAIPYSGDADVRGVLLVAGTHSTASISSRWFVRTSNDLGATYTTSDEFLLTTGGTAAALSVKFSPAGSAWAAGWGTNSSGALRGVIRKLSCN